SLHDALPILKNEKGWEVKKLEELIIKLETGCSVNSIEKVDSNSTNLYILKTSCVYDGNFRLSERKIVAPNDIKRLKTNPKSNSIIISRMNTPELVAKSAYVKSGSKDTFLPDRLWQSIHSELPHNVLWLSYLLGTKKMLVEIQKKALGTSGSMKNISKVDFLNTKIIFPPIHLQEEFAKKIEIIHQLKAQTNAEKSEELFQSLLQRAFKGELVS